MGLKTTQFESVLEAVPAALVGMDQEGAIRFVNRQTELLFGHDREQLIGQHINVLVPEVLWPFYDRHRDDLFADPQSRSIGVDLELSGRHHDGGEFPISITLSYVDTGDVLLAIAAVGDVARHKQAVAKTELVDAIVRYSGEAIMGADLSGIITSWNPAAERLYGYSSQEALGSDASLLMPEDRAGGERALLAKIKDGVAVEHFETMGVRKDGTVFPVSLSVAPVRGEDGAVVGATAVHHDVTEQGKAFQAAQRLAAIVESSDDAIIGKTLDGIITSWNAAATRMYGYSDQEILGEPIELLSPRDRPGEIKDILAKVKAGLRVEHFETECVRKDGAVFPVSLTVSPIRDPEGAVVGASTIAHDVTELRQAFARAQDVIEAAPDALVGVDQGGVIAFVNRQTELSFGYDRDELVGQLVETLVPESFRAVHPGHRASYGADPVNRPMGAGLELTGRRRDGTQFPVDISLSSVQTKDGLLVAAAVRDVTEQRRASEAAARLAAIVKSSDDAIIGTTLEGIVTTWNAAAERMLGYSSEEIIGRSGALLNDTDRAQARPAAQAAIGAGQHVDRFETMLTRKDGTRFPASCTLSGISGTDGRVVGASLIARDLTEQVQKEKALAEASWQYRLLAENASDLVVMTSPDRVITWVSPSLTRSLGWSVEDLLGKRLLDLVHPDDAAATEGPREALYSGHEFSTPAGGFLMRYRTKFGLYRWMAGVATPVTDESHAFTGVVSGLRDVQDLVAAREEAQADRAILRATLDSLRDPHVLFAAVRDESGQIVDFRFADANPAACAYDGIAYQDLVGSRMLHHYPGVVGAGLLEQYTHVVETGQPLRLDDVVYPMETMGGQDRYLDISAARVGDGLSYTWRDVTDRHVAAARLAQSQDRYRLLAENA
jgi:PAS domain S-box-containing protein